MVDIAVLGSLNMDLVVMVPPSAKAWGNDSRAWLPNDSRRQGRQPGSSGSQVRW